MNKMRRKELRDLAQDVLKSIDKDDIQDCIDTLENLKDEESEYYDYIPENLKNSNRAYASEEAIEYMDSALDKLSIAHDLEDEKKVKKLLEEAYDDIRNAAF